MEPIELFAGAAGRAAELARAVRTEQRSLPTPCSAWDVAALLDHMAGGMTYLLGALELDPVVAAAWPAPSAVEACIAALRSPGALARTCQSPAGFPWTVAEAAAGTAMDQLIHTWDLAVAIGAARALDVAHVEAVVAMFLPAMPDVGRAAGFVGPAVDVPADAPAQDRLLGAMGRDPSR